METLKSIYREVVRLAGLAHASYLRNRKAVGTTLLVCIAAAQADQRVREHVNLSLALAIVAAAVRQSGADKSDEFYREK